MATDITESGNDIILEMHIPGIDTENLKIKVEDTHVHISGSREEKYTSTFTIKAPRYNL